MHIRSHRYLSQVICLMLLAMLTGVGSASDAPDPYVAAANEAGVPLPVLIAVVGAESAYHPWALDVEGRQVFCRSRAEAESVLATTATANVDIGLMQINWRFWGPRLGVAKIALLDPALNLRMGARILRDSLEQRHDVASHQQLSFGGAPRARALQQAGIRRLSSLPARRRPVEVRSRRAGTSSCPPDTPSQQPR
jgi:transglycosylase-like protein with SLT domain